MHIDKVTNATKIADIVISNDPKWNKLIDLEYVCSDEVKKSKNTAVYFFVINGNIAKIGGTSAKNGLVAGCLSFYKDGLNGNPALRTFDIPAQSYRHLLKGDKVEVYAILMNDVETEVSGLTGTKVVMTKPSHKDSEQACLADYKEYTGSYPAWNYQESAGRSPENIREAYNMFMDLRNQHISPVDFSTKQVDNIIGLITEG